MKVDTAVGEAREVWDGKGGRGREGVNEGAHRGGVGASGARKVGREGPAAEGELGVVTGDELYNPAMQSGGALDLPELAGEEEGDRVLGASVR